MKRYAFGVLLVLALVATAGGVLAGCGGPGPEATVRAAFEAMENKDAEELGSYFTEDVKDEVAAWAEIIFDIADIDISNLETEVTSQTDDEATVGVEYDYELTVFGQTNEDHQSQDVDLVKEDGKWLIDTSFDFGWE